jgi:Ca2+-transporting ATPase
VQLLWVNLLTDGLPALALGADTSGEVMDRPPRERTSGIIDREMLTVIGGAGAVATAILLGVMYRSLGGAPRVTPYAMTMVFTGLVCFEFLKLFVVRWIRDTATLSNPWLFGAVGVSFLLHLGVLYTPVSNYFGTVPLSGGDWLELVGAGLIGFPLLLGVGWIARNVVRPEQATTESGHSGDDPAELAR